MIVDGDYVVAVNPPPANESAYLHDTLALQVAHHSRACYEHSLGQTTEQLGL